MDKFSIKMVNSEQGRILKNLINEHALLRASRLEKSIFFLKRACSRNRDTRVVRGTSRM